MLFLNPSLSTPAPKWEEKEKDDFPVVAKKLVG